MYTLTINIKFTNFDKMHLNYRGYLRSLYDKSNMCSTLELQENSIVYRPACPDARITDFFRESEDTWKWVERSTELNFKMFSSFMVSNAVKRISEHEYKHTMIFFFDVKNDYLINKFLYKPLLKYRSWKLRQKKII